MAKGHLKLILINGGQLEKRVKKRETPLAIDVLNLISLQLPFL